MGNLSLTYVDMLGQIIAPPLGSRSFSDLLHWAGGSGRCKLVMKGDMEVPEGHNGVTTALSKGNGTIGLMVNMGGNGSFSEAELQLPADQVENVFAKLPKLGQDVPAGAPVVPNPEPPEKVPEPEAETESGDVVWTTRDPAVVAKMKALLEKLQGDQPTFEKKAAMDALSGLTGVTVRVSLSHFMRGLFKLGVIEEVEKNKTCRMGTGEPLPARRTTKRTRKKRARRPGAIRVDPLKIRFGKHSEVLDLKEVAEELKLMRKSAKALETIAAQAVESAAAAVEDSVQCKAVLASMEERIDQMEAFLKEMETEGATES